MTPPSTIRKRSSQHSANNATKRDNNRETSIKDNFTRERKTKTLCSISSLLFFVFPFVVGLLLVFLCYWGEFPYPNSSLPYPLSNNPRNTLPCLLLGVSWTTLASMGYLRTPWFFRCYAQQHYCRLVPMHGTANPAFRPVVDAFRRNLRLRGEIGAAIAVYCMLTDNNADNDDNWEILSTIFIVFITTVFIK